MQNVPQIVRQRLQSVTSVGEHPDADVLTAFAELSLENRERAGVLEHLSGCVECREIIAFALPEIESVAPSRVIARGSWLSWPALRWGFAAGGLALLSLGVLRYDRYRHQTPESAASKQSAEMQVGASNTVGQPTSAAPSPLVRRETGPAGTKALSASSGHRPLRVAGVKEPAHWVTAEGSSFARGNESQSSATEIAQATSSSHNFLENSSSESMSRAKPAEIVPGALPSAIGSTRWSITAVGSLQRSLDGGNTWQDVDVRTNLLQLTPSEVLASGNLPATENGKSTNHIVTLPALPAVFFRSVTAVGSDVWAGGSNTVLFHSLDGGNTWMRVLPSSAGIALTGDVISLQFSNPQSGAVTTSSGEIWITSDAGQTWRRQ